MLHFSAFLTYLPCIHLSHLSLSFARVDFAMKMGISNLDHIIG